MDGVMMGDKEADQKAGALAEYTAMRAEILQCSQQMSNLFTALIATVGVVSGVVLRPNAGLTDSLVVMLVLPVVSYLIVVRYLYLYTGAVRIGIYIETKLEQRIMGEGGWESWFDENKSAVRAKKSAWILRQGLADWLAFLGTAVLGLVGSAYGISHKTGGSRTVLCAAWCLGAILTGLTIWTLVAKRSIRSRIRPRQAATGTAARTDSETAADSRGPNGNTPIPG
jgi:hypothetical protein